MPHGVANNTRRTTDATLRDHRGLGSGAGPAAVSAANHRFGTVRDDLIPHDDIMENQTLDYLLHRFGVPIS